MGDGAAYIVVKEENSNKEYKITWGLGWQMCKHSRSLKGFDLNTFPTVIEIGEEVTVFAEYLIKYQKDDNSNYAHYVCSDSEMTTCNAACTFIEKIKNNS